LQLRWAAEPEVGSVGEFCVRTLNFRRGQEWPPLPLRPMDDWEPAYKLSREETEIDGGSLVLADIDSAREWLKQIITSINATATMWNHE
ncbi:MAG: hypothetical protein L0G54_11155, partial [Brevibacterium sp.]|nr:hypothetical protein [Brevibacterium sp.]